MVTLAGLVTTGVLLAASVEAWRPVFALSHLAALFALLPLGLVLVATHYSAARAEVGSALGGLRLLLATHRVEVALTVLAFLGVAVTLSQFDGGVREVRRVANVVTVASVVALVVRYLRSGSPRVPEPQSTPPLAARPEDEISPELSSDVLMQERARWDLRR